MNSMERKIHYWWAGKVLCSQNNSVNIGGICATEKKSEVTCTRCLNKMKKWGWEV